MKSKKEKEKLSDDLMARYHANLMKMKEQEDENKERARKAKESREQRRLIQRLDIQVPLKKTEASKEVLSLLSWEDTPLIKSHPLVERSASGREQFKKALCPEEYGVECPLCKLRYLKGRSMTDAEKSATYKSKNKVMLLFDPNEVGRNVEYDGKNGRVSFASTPNRFFYRTPGDGDVNFYNLQSIETNTEKPLNDMMLSISKNTSGTTAAYSINSVFKTVGKPVDPLSFEMEDSHREFLESIIEARDKGDILKLFDIAARTFELPKELDSYPDPSTNLLFRPMDEEFSGESFEEDSIPSF